MQEADAALIAAALAVVAPRRLSPVVEVAGVGAALRTATGRIFRGVCIDGPAASGFAPNMAPWPQ